MLVLLIQNALPDALAKPVPQLPPPLHLLPEIPPQAPPQPAAYVLVDGEDIIKATDAITEVTSLQQNLHWINQMIKIKK